MSCCGKKRQALDPSRRTLASPIGSLQQPTPPARPPASPGRAPTPPGTALQSGLRGVSAGPDPYRPVPRTPKERNPDGR
jgi:hypothetical protein